MPDASRPTSARQPERRLEDQPIIEVRQLGKRFKIYNRPWGRVAEWASGGSVVRHEDFWALRDISFAVARGESLGVIGINGSGKSTLLKILSGAMYATEGEFRVSGRVLSLLELGTGLSPELSGRQNVTNSAQLLTYGPEYANARMPQIEAFAELGDFFDRPIRLYSSGMLVRLVFSMFACFDPDVFIVDEALSVGDIYFQQKCAQRIRQMLRDKVTMLFVSHDLAAVEALCDRVMLLHGGEMRHLGDKLAGIRMYYAVSGAGQPRGGAIAPEPESASSAAQAAAATGKSNVIEGESIPKDVIESLPWQSPDERDDIGTGKMKVTGVCYKRLDGNPEPVVEQNEWLDLYVRFRALQDVGPLNTGVTLFDRLNRLVFGRGWTNADIDPISLRRGEELISRVRLRMDVEAGEYIVMLGAAEALRDAASPNGWNQSFGGERYVELPHGSKIAVLPRSDRRKLGYGPANLETEFARVVKER